MGVLKANGQLRVAQDGNDPQAESFDFNQRP